MIAEGTLVHTVPDIVYICWGGSRDRSHRPADLSSIGYVRTLKDGPAFAEMSPLQTHLVNPSHTHECHKQLNDSRFDRLQLNQGRCTGSHRRDNWCSSWPDVSQDEKLRTN
jgi:hypothetical protein